MIPIVVAISKRTLYWLRQVAASPDLRRRAAVAKNGATFVATIHPPSWSVFIFGYNEETTIREVVTQAARVLRDITPVFEIIVIDDGSTDGSAAVVRAAAEELPSVRLVRHPVNWGIGRTLADGYHLCRNEIVCGVPADGEFALPCLYDAAAIVPDADVICFYRQGRRSPSVRRFLTGGHCFLNRTFLGLTIRDVNWVKVYRRQVLDAFPVRSRSPLIETELLAQARRNGMRIVELPSPFRMRENAGGAGLRGTLWNGLKMTWELVLLCFRFRLLPHSKQEKS